MLVQCYRSRQPLQLQDALSLYVQRVGGWLSVSSGYVDYFIPEQYAVMVPLLDSHIERKSHMDYYV
jgi:hypothetical protein